MTELNNIVNNIYVVKIEKKIIFWQCVVDPY